MRNANLQVNVELTVQSSNDSRDEPTLKLQITDRASSTAVVQVELTAGQFLSALSGLHLGDLPAWFTPRREIIGKQMVHRLVDVPRDVIGGLSYQGTEREEAVRRWAKDQAAPGETVETRNTNQGWKVIFRSYVDQG